MNQDLQHFPGTRHPPGDDAGRSDVESSGGATFLELYCRRYHCPPERARQKILWHCLHRRLLQPVAWGLHLLQPKTFLLDLGLINHVGAKTDAHSVVLEVRGSDAFDQFHPDNNFFRKSLGLRLSRRKLITLAHETFGAAGRG